MLDGVGEAPHVNMAASAKRFTLRSASSRRVVRDSPLLLLLSDCAHTRTARTGLDGLISCMAFIGCVIDGPVVAIGCSFSFFKLTKPCRPSPTWTTRRSYAACFS